MTEINYILTTMTDRSLVIIDELCRSTSLEEGTAIAMTICEKLGRSKAYTYITTHFTLLTKLYDLFFNLKVWQLETIPSGDPADPKTMKLDFKFSLVPGVTTLKGYGIYMVRGIWPKDVMAHVDEIQQTYYQATKDPTFPTVDKRARLNYNLKCRFKKLHDQKKFTLSNLNEHLQKYEKEMEQIDEECREFSENFSQIMMEQIQRESEMNRQTSLDHSIFNAQDPFNGYNDITAEELPKIFIDDLTHSQYPNVMGCISQAADINGNEQLRSNNHNVVSGHGNSQELLFQTDRQRKLEMFTPDSKLNLCDSDVSQLTIEPDIYMNLDTTYGSQCSLNITKMAMGLDNGHMGRDVLEEPTVRGCFDNYQQEKMYGIPYENRQNLDTSAANISPIVRENVEEITTKTVPPNAPKSSPSFIRFFAPPLIGSPSKTSTPLLTKIQYNAKNFGTSSSINVTSPNGQNMTKITTPKITFTLLENAPADLDINSLAEDMESFVEDMRQDATDETFMENEEPQLVTYKNQHISSGVCHKPSAENNNKHIFPRVRILVGPNQPSSEEDFRSNSFDRGQGTVVRPVVKGLDRFEEPITNLTEQLKGINVQFTQDYNEEEGNDESQEEGYSIQEKETEEDKLIEAFNSLSNLAIRKNKETIHEVFLTGQIANADNPKMIEDLTSQSNNAAQDGNVTEPTYNNPNNIEEMIKAFNRASEEGEQIKQSSHPDTIEEMIHAFNESSKEKQINDGNDPNNIGEMIKASNRAAEGDSVENQETGKPTLIDRDNPSQIKDMISSFNRESEVDEARNGDSPKSTSIIINKSDMKQRLDDLVQSQEEDKRDVSNKNTLLEDKSPKGNKNITQPENYALKNLVVTSTDYNATDVTKDSHVEEYFTADSSGNFSYSPLVPRSQDENLRVETAPESHIQSRTDLIKSNVNDTDWDAATVRLRGSPSTPKLDAEECATQEYRTNLKKADELLVQTNSKVELEVKKHEESVNINKDIPQQRGLFSSHSGVEVVDIEENSCVSSVFDDNGYEERLNPKDAMPVPVETKFESRKKIEVHDVVFIRGPTEKNILTEASFDTCNTTYLLDSSTDKRNNKIETFSKIVDSNERSENERLKLKAAMPKSDDTKFASRKKIEVHDANVLRGPKEKRSLTEVSFDTCNTTYLLDSSNNNEINKIETFTETVENKSEELINTTADNELSFGQCNTITNAKSAIETSLLSVRRKPTLGMRKSQGPRKSLFTLNTNTAAKRKSRTVSLETDTTDNKPAKKQKLSSSVPIKGNSDSSKSQEAKDKTQFTSISEASRLRNLEGETTNTSSSKQGNSGGNKENVEEGLSDISRKRNLDEECIITSIEKRPQISTSTTNKEGSSNSVKKKPQKKKAFRRFKAPLKKSSEDLIMKKTIASSSSEEIISAVEDTKAVRDKKGQAPRTTYKTKLSQKAIRTEFFEQDKRFFETIDSSGSSVDVAKLWEERMKRPPRPTPKQIQQSTCVATIRKTNEGVEVIPSEAKKPKNSKKRFNSFRFQPHPTMNMNIFSDQNAETFDEFIKSKSNDYTMFNFKLEYGQKSPVDDQEEMFDFKQVNTATSEYTQNSQSWTFVRKTQEDSNSSNRLTNFQFNRDFMTFENNSTSQNSSRDHRNDISSLLRGYK